MQTVEDSVTRSLGLRAATGVTGPQQEGWEDGWTQAQLDAIYAEVAALVPASATKVLELGCGVGKFGHALHTAQSSIGYEGLDLSLEATADAIVTQNSHTLSCETGNLWEYLTEATVDWDFLVSIRTAFDWTPDPGDKELLKLIDSKAAKGFIIIAPKARLRNAKIQTRLAGEVTSQSNTVTSSFFTGPDSGAGSLAAANASLAAALAAGPGDLTAIYIMRTSTTASAPPQNPRWVVVANDKYEAARVTAKIDRENLKGNNNVEDYTGITKTGGRITGRLTRTLAQAPARAKTTERMAKAQKRFNKRKGQG